MNEQQLIERAKHLGKEAARAAKGHDFQTLKSYSSQKYDLCRYYPNHAKKIREAYDLAYKSIA